MSAIAPPLSPLEQLADEIAAVLDVEQLLELSAALMRYRVFYDPRCSPGEQLLLGILERELLARAARGLAD